MNTLKKTMPELERLSTTEFQEAEKHPIVVVLEDVRSMHNVGSVFRTADCFRIQKIYLCGYTPCPPHRDIQKTALGATETVPWLHWPDALQAIQQLRETGYQILSIEQAHGSVTLQSHKFSPLQPIALVFGNEVDGVSERVLQASDGMIEIPQAGSKHSLNVSVCAGIVLWEASRIYL